MISKEKSAFSLEDRCPRPTEPPPGFSPSPSDRHTTRPYEVRLRLSPVTDLDQPDPFLPKRPSPEYRESLERILSLPGWEYLALQRLVRGPTRDRTFYGWQEKTGFPPPFEAARIYLRGRYFGRLLVAPVGATPSGHGPIFHVVSLRLAPGRTKVLGHTAVVASDWLEATAWVWRHYLPGEGKSPEDRVFCASSAERVPIEYDGFAFLARPCACCFVEPRPTRRSIRIRAESRILAPRTRFLAFTGYRDLAMHCALRLLL